LAAAGDQMITVAGDHGKGFSAHASTLLEVAQSQKICQNDGEKRLVSNHAAQVPSHAPQSLTTV
jgi:hypothetical protein